MTAGITRQRILTTLVALVLMLSAAFYALAQQTGEAKKPGGGKRHTLAATLETVQWGWLDPKEPPKLTVDSGDTVSIETMMHSHDKVRPGITMDEIVALRRANPGGGPHSMTGPDLRQRRRARRRDGDPHRQDRPQAVRHQLQSSRQRFPDDRRAAPRDARRVRQVLHPGPQKRRRSSSPESRSISKPFPGTLAVGIDPNDPRRARAA
jgi:hypothetical protein